MDNFGKRKKNFIFGVCGIDRLIGRRRRSPNKRGGGTMRKDGSGWFCALHFLCVNCECVCVCVCVCVCTK